MPNISFKKSSQNVFRLFYIREYFFPSGCGGCGQALLCPMDTYYGLCKDCRKLFLSAFNEKNRCEICGKPLISEKNTCLSCRNYISTDSGIFINQLEKGKVEKLISLFPYTGKFKSILGSYKFGKSAAIGNFFLRCLRAGSGSFDRETLLEAAWVPVPPRPKKIKTQGWDQIEYLAGLLEKEYRKKTAGALDFSRGRFPVCRCLKRLPSRSQKELNREGRGTNLKGRILCVKPPPKIAILFDDVITTGATMSACASALLEGGASRVYGVCLFYD